MQILKNVYVSILISRRLLELQIRNNTPKYLTLTRHFSRFNTLVETEDLKVYRLASPLFLKYPSSRIINRIALRIHNTLDNIFGAPIKRITMPPIPPEKVRGMKVLDREAFTATIQVPSLKVPFKQVGAFQKVMKKYMFRMRGIKPVAEPADYDLEKDNYRLFLLDPDVFQEVGDLKKTLGDDFDPESYSVDLSSWRILNVTLTYKNWHHDDIIRAITPKDSEAISGFSAIGHIIHLNMKDELLDYKKIIGEVLLDKVPAAETVVNKTNTIDNTFRNFSMEVIAGKDDFITEAKENGNIFKMNFSKVYWNPRLGTEHQRIVDQLRPGDIVYDVFAGIGPFSVPAVKRGCAVFANDLNPESFKWLKINIKPKKNYPLPKLFNLDGREFIRTIVAKDLTKRWTEEPNIEEQRSSYNIHFVMNLPALAVEFLDVLPGLLSEIEDGSIKGAILPKVHCYSFSKADDPVEDVKSRIETILGCSLPEGASIRLVRNVAPNKDMLCAEFEIPKELLLRGTAVTLGEDGDLDKLSQEPPTKKSKTEELEG